ncbi:hypothetical protein SARC_01528 [Sphaeroforma arctica JP610]|uniref:Uncharacterized protein n=1 Tax=Sphaeroforma arctica JP610 TaxID=667725 RepID=A0A0L0GBF5_9EUKA|nr:hypothetical protein SARC_01528 [Sphaeroforma arctica JP610]KNC86335.1 hypothetical protein SARC_01528 [Sphaeroforma arctica JP610]|eukprot:XP_014160237.1 hypothetical protein SARC_01528 [Sphaeroforma arctica JP610]
MSFRIGVLGENDSVWLHPKQVIDSATPDNASNVQAAMNLTEHVTMGCRAHRMALVMKKVYGGALITATDKNRHLREVDFILT